MGNTIIITGFSTFFSFHMSAASAGLEPPYLRLLRWVFTTVLLSLDMTELLENFLITILSPKPMIHNNIFWRQEEELQGVSQNVVTLDGEVMAVNGRILAGHSIGNGRSLLAIGMEPETRQANVCREIGLLLSFVYIFGRVAQRCC
jgi:hypothetical protein